MIAAKDDSTPIDLYLEKQQMMTPVARFSKEHESQQIPDQEVYYRDLIPLSKPKQGEQYAFEVDLDKCTGCKACVTACHSLNGLEEDETWRDVGLIHGGDKDHPFQQTVTTACHHCVDPGCMNGCPVLAYEKDEATGIVVHLDDQCIGCQYCVLKCPYDVPKYSERLGIVRKCDMCHDRLADGEAPACVQACPTEAIKITLVDTEEASARIDVDEFLQGAPEPSYTKPTTRYVSNKSLPKNLEAADKHELKPQHPHWPLILMLSLTQMAVGATVFTWLGGLWGLSALGGAITVGVGMVALKVGMLSSVMHLGQPLKSWRAFLGLRKSWLSREIVVFGAFGPAAMLFAAVKTLPLLSQWIGEWSELAFLPQAVKTLLALSVVGFGLLGVFCSAMIYHDTQRAFWRIGWSGFKFFATTLLLGGASASVGIAWSSRFAEADYAVGALIFTLLVLGVKLVAEALFLKAAKSETYSDDRQSAAILLGSLNSALKLRFASSLAGGVGLLIALFSPSFGFLFAGAALLLLITGEIAERYLYFRAVVAPKMPGGI